MLLFTLTSLISLATALPLPQSHHVPSVEEAAQYARTLVHRESLANVATIVQHGDLSGTPESFMEYYADCDGTLTFLAINMSTTYRNVAAGSPVSLAIRAGDHPLHDNVNPHYPGAIPQSPAGSPRISLRGRFVPLDIDQKTTACFLHRHKDAAWWLPGNRIHSSYWLKFQVDGVYFVGGFGDRAYIGEIPVDLYNAAEPLPSKCGDMKEMYLKHHSDYRERNGKKNGKHGKDYGKHDQKKHGKHDQKKHAKDYGKKKLDQTKHGKNDQKHFTHPSHNDKPSFWKMINSFFSTPTLFFQQNHSFSLRKQRLVENVVNLSEDQLDDLLVKIHH